MKTKLLFLSLIATALVQAQGPVPSYYGTNDAVFSVVTGNAINHNASGANATWNFSNMGVIGQSVDTERATTTSENSSFPTSTKVVITASDYLDGTSAEFKIFSKAPANALSITGIDNGGLLLNYNTNNALLGTFPLNYGYTNTDNIAGSYDNGEYSGTFTGTLVTSVDAWGTLNTGGTGQTAYSGAVTRLKTVQNISLNYGIFNGVGTVVVTTYSYYPTTGNSLPVGIPRFRSTTTSVNVPLLSINQTLSQNESFLALLLANEGFAKAAQDVVLAPNPVDQTLNVNTSAHIQNISVTDALGKIVLHATEAQTDVSALTPGVYFATITTDAGSTTKKFIKK